jgi:ABC-type transport system involved in multi-copper enzyme maturation permease subunit
MLWYKSWIETRWRFLIGLALLACSAAGIVLAYPKMRELMAMAPEFDVGGEIGRQIRESVELARDYRGYVWSQWFVKSLPQMWVLFAALLGTGALAQSGGGTLFTLSLPVSRRRLLAIRAATGLIELFALALVPALLIPVLSPAVGQSYGLGAALVHALCLFVAGSVFFGLAFLLSTVFSDVWRPWLIVLCAALGIGLIDQVVPGAWGYSIFRVMSAETYFRGGGLPWLGLLASAAVSVAAFHAATVNIARRDF